LEFPNQIFGEFDVAGEIFTPLASGSELLIPKWTPNLVTKNVELLSLDISTTT